jgi:ketosteroid isomerase-like protein
VSEQEIAVIREQFDAVNRRDFPRAMELYAEDVVLVVPPAEGVPRPGTYTGKEAVGGWYGDWFQMFDRDFHTEIDEARDLGGMLLVHAWLTGHGRVSGAEVTGDFAYLYEVRQGQIARVGFFATREDALQAAELPEWSNPKTD